MRKFMVLPMAGLLALAVAAPAAAAPNVSNSSGGGDTIYGEWYTDQGYGYVMLGQEAGYGFGEIYQEIGEWVECAPAGDGGIVPKDTTPGDGGYGFVGTRIWGYSKEDITVTLSRRLETGSGSGTMELYTETVDECAGIDEGASETVSIDVSVTGIGSLASFRNSGVYKIPSEFNAHQNLRGKERAASGSVVAGSIDQSFDSASMSRVTWTEHVNQ
jgi:hypothetical protein